MENLGLNLGMLFVQIANFAIIMVVLYAWVYKPVLGLLSKRRQMIAQGLEDARIAAEARANAEKEAAKILQDAQIKSADLIRDATVRAEEVELELKNEIEVEITKMRANAKDELELERNRTLGELRGQVVSLAIAATQKLIGESLTVERQHTLLKEFFSGVKSGHVVILDNQELAGVSAEVTSALPLTPEEQEIVKKDLLKTLTGGGTIAFRIDPSIMGGLVVRVGDRVVDGSVIGQLQSLRQSLQ